MRISDWSSEVCSSDLLATNRVGIHIIAKCKHVAYAERIKINNTAVKGTITRRVDRVSGKPFHAHPAFMRAPGAFRDTQSKADRKSVVSGKSVSVRVDLGGRRIITKKKKINTRT